MAQRTSQTVSAVPWCASPAVKALHITRNLFPFEQGLVEDPLTLYFALRAVPRELKLTCIDQTVTALPTYILRDRSFSVESLVFSKCGVEVLMCAWFSFGKVTQKMQFSCPHCLRVAAAKRASAPLEPGTHVRIVAPSHRLHEKTGILVYPPGISRRWTVRLDNGTIVKVPLEASLTSLDSKVCPHFLAPEPQQLSGFWAARRRRIDAARACLRMERTLESEIGDVYTLPGCTTLSAASYQHDDDNFEAHSGERAGQTDWMSAPVAESEADGWQEDALGAFDGQVVSDWTTAPVAECEANGWQDDVQASEDEAMDEYGELMDLMAAAQSGEI